MRKFKKMTAVVLAVAMVLSLMSISVFAEGEQTLIDLTLTADKTSVGAGETVDVSIDFTPKAAGPFIQGALAFKLEYDKQAFDASIKSIDSTWEGTSDTNFIDATPQFACTTTMSLTGAKTNIAVITFTAKSDIANGTYAFNAINAYGNLLDNSNGFLADVTNATVTVGGSAPVPTATPDAQPTAKPTAKPTATPVPAVKASIPTIRFGKDYVVSVTRTEASKAAAVKVVLKNAAGVEIIGEATFAEGETKAQVEFTADQIASIAEVGETVDVTVTYNGEGVESESWNEDVTVRKPGGSHGNSGLSTTPGGVVTPTPKPGPGTEPTATPAGEQPTTAPVETSVFTDVPASHWAYSYIMDLYEDGIVNGVSATQFMPDANVTRAEFTKMAAGIFGLTATSATSQFVDVPAGEWYAQSVIAATEAGIVQGISDTEFGPEENITREQMATIIGRQLGMTSSAAVVYTDSASIEAYAVPYVAALTEAGYLTGDNGQFNPKANATRAEAATLLDRVYVSIAASEPTEEPEATTAPETTAEPEATTEPEAEATATAEPEATAEAEATETPAAE